MVEVFKTNVNDPADADLLVKELHKAFAVYKANFDLDDCDRILRVKSLSGPVNPFPIMVLLRDFGFVAEPLPDNSQQGGVSSFTWNLMAGK